MKKLILVCMLIIGLFSGCDNGTKIKHAFRNVDPKCKKIVNELNSDGYYNSDQVIIITMLIINCDNTQKILKEIRKTK